MQQSRQVLRQMARIKQKSNRRLAVGGVSASGKSRLRMNKHRVKILHGISVAAANSLEAPATVLPEDRLSYQAEQRSLAYELNNEFMQAAQPHGGKKPQGVFAIPSIAMRKDRTNPIGYFS